MREAIMGRKLNFKELKLEFGEICEVYNKGNTYKNSMNARSDLLIKEEDRINSSI